MEMSKEMNDEQIEQALSPEDREKILKEIGVYYQEITQKLFADRKAAADFLKFSGKFYKIPAEQIMLVYEQNPQATIIAEQETWQAFDNSVPAKEKSIFTLSGDKIKRYYDISQTIEKVVPFQWTVNKENIKEFLTKIRREEHNSYNSLTSYINDAAKKAANEAMELLQSRVEINYSDRNKITNSISSMIAAVISARCEHNCSYRYDKDNIRPIDLSAIDILTNKQQVKILFSAVQICAKKALLKIEKSITEIIRRTEENVREQEHDLVRKETSSHSKGENSQRSEDDLVRAGRGLYSGDNQGREQRLDLSAGPKGLVIQPDGVLHEQHRGTGTAERADRVLRQAVDRVHGTELSAGYNGLERNVPVGDNSEGNRQGSRRDVPDSKQAIRTEQSPPNGELRGDSKVGENEADRNQTSNNGGHSSEAKTISEKEKTLEEKSNVFFSSGRKSGKSKKVDEPEQLSFFESEITTTPKNIKIPDQSKLINSLADSYAQWDKIYKNGNTDPLYADGVSLNLIRNHIIYYQKMNKQRKM